MVILLSCFSDSCFILDKTNPWLAAEVCSEERKWRPPFCIDWAKVEKYMSSTTEKEEDSLSSNFVLCVFAKVVVLIIEEVERSECPTIPFPGR